MDGRRWLFPEQAVDALAFTSLGESFAFACHRDVSLVEMCGYTIIYRLQVRQGIENCSLEFVQNQLTGLDSSLSSSSELELIESELELRSS